MSPSATDARKLLDPFQGFNFFVEIEGLLVASFSECSGLQVETEVQEYAEGGLNDYTHHFRGRTKYPPLVLKKGLTLNNQLWRWHQGVIEGKVERKNGTIYLLDTTYVPVIWWNFKKAFPVKWTGPDLRANSSDAAIESVELIHQGLSSPLR
ncbi:MAG TPA: phage tail protein [Pyrinomonadaceae bacterium]